MNDTELRLGDLVLRQVGGRVLYSVVKLRIRDGAQQVKIASLWSRATYWLPTERLTLWSRR